VDRSEYGQKSLDLGDLLADPIDQLQRWLDDASEAKVVEPSAMCLSTVSAAGRPSSRMVLLRGLDARGLAFYSNYESRKGQEIEAHPDVCVNFWWGPLERQVRVEGRVTRLDPKESDAYFASRPHPSQVASAASPQSQVVESRQELESRVQRLADQYPNNVPRPDNWGGYLLTPDRFEFWQGRAARLHDRLAYRLEAGRWKIERLAP